MRRLSLNYKNLFYTFLILPTIAFCQEPNNNWAPKQGPLMTPWSAKVSPANPRPEYPRPQLVRKDWLNLNGLWDFKEGTTTDSLTMPDRFEQKILVPFPVESALSGVMKHVDRLWYHRKFRLPVNWAGQHIRLNFDAVDWITEVFVNKKKVGTHQGGYDAFSFDITSFLVKGEQDVMVRVYDPTEAYGQPRGKQTTKPVGIMYTPTSGIWQSVWLEPVDSDYISDIALVPDVDQQRLTVTVNAAQKQNLSVIVRAKDGKQTVGTVSGKEGSALTINIPQAKLWSPDNPFLYDLEIELKKGAVVTDKVASYFGMRKIALAGDGGFKKIYLNNKFVYETGVLDQGFWPDGIYTAPTDDALKYDLVQAKNMGFNLIRKHLKVEPQRWYYWADKLGILVWQDMPSINSYLPKDAIRPAIDKDAFKNELTAMINTHRNSPAIILWVLFNESQGYHDSGDLVEYIHQLDPSRLINEHSGSIFYGHGDITDRHSYPAPSCPESKTKAIVIGEFGGIGYKYIGHTWAAKADGYTNAVNPADLVFLYTEFNDKLRDFKNHNGLSASIYTQLTDVETETNGLMTYDRIPKYDVREINRLNTYHFSKPAFETIIPAADQLPQEWKYTFQLPTGNWKSESFDDNDWSTGKGGFGKNKNFSHTDWATDDIWLRKTFNIGTLSKEQIDKLIVHILYDRDIEIYINGVSAFVDHGSRNAYENRNISQEAKNAIHTDQPNIIAVHTKKRTGQFIDVGLYRLLPDTYKTDK